MKLTPIPFGPSETRVLRDNRSIAAIFYDSNHAENATLFAGASDLLAAAKDVLLGSHGAAARLRDAFVMCEDPLKAPQEPETAIELLSAIGSLMDLAGRHTKLSEEQHKALRGKIRAVVEGWVQ